MAVGGDDVLSKTSIQRCGIDILEITDYRSHCFGSLAAIPQT